MIHLKTTLPRLVLVVMALVLVLGAIPAQAAKPNLVPAISLGPLSHREELRATVNAKAKLTRVELRIDNKKVQPWVKAHAGWKYTIRHPLNKLAVGMHTAKLQVWDQKNRSTQRQWKFQKLAQLALSADKSSVQPGEKVTVTGQGFTPGTAITVGIGGQNIGVGGNYGSAVADRSGAFTVDVTLDKFPDGSPLKPGTVVLLAHTADFAEKASAQLQVQAPPTLTASKTTIRVGEWLVLSGEGFTPGKVITIRLAGIDMGHGDRYGTAEVDTNGRFSTQLLLGRYPDGTPLAPGGITLMASTTDGEHALVNLRIVADPTISLSKASIKPGEQVLVTGQGFTPGASISISMGPVNGGTGGNYGKATVDTTGRFSLPVTLARYPDGSPLKPGTIVLLAHTADFSRKAGAPLQILATPAIALDKTVIQPGERVTVTGQGFTPGTSVSISLGGVNTGASGNYGTALVDGNGRFSLAVTLERYPNGLPLQAGPIVLVAHNAAWTQTASAQLQIVDRAPSAPSDLRITSLTKGGTSAEPTVVGLQWRDNSPNETGFRIQATFTRMNGGTDTQVWNVAANATSGQLSFVAGGINPVSKACFTVTAFTSQGNSAPSNEVCVVL